MNATPRVSSSSNPISGGLTATSSISPLTSSISPSWITGSSAQFDPGWDSIYGEEEEEIDFEHFYGNKDAIIFLIDCQQAMFQKDSDGISSFESTLRCVISAFADKIISSENDLLGVCFYGTSDKKNPNDFDNIYVLQDLDIPDAQRILDLEGILEDTTFPVGHAEREFPFADALWTCSTMFSNCAVKVSHKRIFLFTNDDNPNEDNDNFRNQALQRGKDLAELSIEIELFALQNPGQAPFNPSLFYQHVISVDDEDGNPSVHFAAASGFEELKTRVRAKEFKKRALGRLSLSLAPGVDIGVRLFNLVQETKKSGFQWLDSKTNQPVRVQSKWVCEDTGSLLMPSQIKYAYVYGGEQVIFSKEEIQKIKTIEQPGLTIMGFKARSALKIHHNVRHASFLYPDEKVIADSFMQKIARRILLSERKRINCYFCCPAADPS